MTNSTLFRLDGQCALVTGASSGLGRHFATVLADAGAKVVLAARRYERLEEIASRINRQGGEALAVRMDVTKPRSISAAFNAAERAFGPLSILINNAGVPSGAYFADTSDEEWRGVMDVNLDGVFHTGREAAQRMRENGEGGAIINIASVLAFGVTKALASYAASKAAVVSLTKSMALELARDGIRVNALAPGYFKTAINSRFLKSAAGRKQLMRVPYRRAGELNELDGALLLLASQAGSYITGSVITVDGGTLLALA